MATAYRVMAQAFPTSTSDWTWDFGTVNGLDPKLVFFWTCKYTDTGFTAGYTNGLAFTFGFSDGTHHGCVAISAEHAVDPSDSYHRGSVTKSIMALSDTDGTLLFAAHVKNFVTTTDHKGFVMTIDDAAGGASEQYVIVAMCLFGDLEAGVGQLGGSGTIGFQPDIGGMLIGSEAAYDDATKINAALSVGFFQRYLTLTQGCRYWQFEDGVAGGGRFWSYLNTVDLLYLVQRTGTIDGQLTLTGFTEDGVTFTGGSPADDPLYWALRSTTGQPIDMGLRTMLMATATGAQALRGFRGTPAGLISSIGKIVTADAVVTANAAQCFGMSAVDDQGADFSIAVQASVAGARSKMQNRIFDIEQLSVPVGRYAGDWTSYDASGGFTWNSTNAGGTPYIQCLALGSTGAKGIIKGAGLLRGAGLVR